MITIYLLAILLDGTDIKRVILDFLIFGLSDRLEVILWELNFRPYPIHMGWVVREFIMLQIEDMLIRVKFIAVLLVLVVLLKGLGWLYQRNFAGFGLWAFHLDLVGLAQLIE